jgi:carboxylesterase
MEREKVVNTVLMPIDFALGASIKGIEHVGLLDQAWGQFYGGLRKVMLTNFRLNNELDIQGAENVPTTGGVILACNHQSWLDVQVLGASCPRRVHFIAKTEFATWPVLRHLIRLSESVFVRRGGDNEALDSIVEALRKGWSVAIFPEGTIPGEEDIPRRAVEAKTGLLPGHTGVARLALRAGVPIVPIGVSGTGRAFPPEAYPRLEVLRMPAATPIRIRFGQPISMDSYKDREQDRELFREVTDVVMHRISALVDHRSNYAPIEVPIPEPPKRKRIGVLLLHGFTSDVKTVTGIVPQLEQAGIPYEAPVLRGHGTRYQDLYGVTARDWYVDAERAMIKLWNKVDRIVVVGFSMGGLVALELAMRHPDKLSGIVTVAACLKYADPLSALTGVLSKVVKYWPMPETFSDPSVRSPELHNYPKMPTRTFAELYDYSQVVADRLHEVHVPIRVLQSKRDTVVAPESANIIYEKVSSPVREIIWYERSGHEMMQDVEKERVFDDIMEFVHRFELKPKQAKRSRGETQTQPGPTY